MAARFPGINSILGHSFPERVRQDWREPCNVGQEWPECENRIPDARVGPSSATQGTKIFVMGGEQFNIMRDYVASLETTTGEWTVHDPHPIARFQAAGSVDGLGRVESVPQTGQVQRCFTIGECSGAGPREAS